MCESLRLTSSLIGFPRRSKYAIPSMHIRSSPPRCKWRATSCIPQRSDRVTSVNDLPLPYPGKDPPLLVRLPFSLTMKRAKTPQVVTKTPHPRPSALSILRLMYPRAQNMGLRLTLRTQNRPTKRTVTIPSRLHYVYGVSYRTPTTLRTIFEGA